MRQITAKFAPGHKVYMPAFTDGFGKQIEATGELTVARVSLVANDGNGNPYYRILAYGNGHESHEGAELGYISIAEIVRSGVELDLYWTPKTLAEVRK